MKYRNNKAIQVTMKSKTIKRVLDCLPDIPIPKANK
jgi:hypothetical protein